MVIRCVAKYNSDVISRLAEDVVHVKSAMPVGNVATGLAWSYFYGYLNFLLKGTYDISDFQLGRS